MGVEFIVNSLGSKRADMLIFCAVESVTMHGLSHKSKHDKSA